MTYFRTNFEEFCARSGCDTAEINRIYEALGGGAWLAGGAIRRTLIGHALDSDFDFFFKSADDLATWEEGLPSGLKLVRETEHHKHWRGTIAGSDLPVDIQAIRFRFYETAEQVIDSFDYPRSRPISYGRDGRGEAEPSALAANAREAPRLARPRRRFHDRDDDNRLGIHRV